jgi:hypothetical protein
MHLERDIHLLAGNQTPEALVFPRQGCAIQVGYQVARRRLNCGR